MTDTDDTDKKEIKVEDGNDDTSTIAQTTSIQDQEPAQLQQAQELISTEIPQNATHSQNESDVVTSASLPTAVITTQRRMITTTGQIR